LETIQRTFKNQKEVNIEALRIHGLVKGRLPVKVLGDGDLTKKLTVKAQMFSAGAREKITKAGGVCEELPLPVIHHKTETK